MRAWAAAVFSAVVLLLAACAPKPLGHPPLWHIQDEDSDIWLFGTVHVLPGDLSWRGANFDAAFNAVDELVTETDVSDAADTATLAARYGVLPEGELLSERLTPNARRQLTRVLHGLNTDPATIEPLRPWLAGLRISYLYAASRGQQSEAGVESVLLPEARARGLHLAYLETPEQQIHTLADLSEADQIRFLESTLREIEANDDILETTQRAWAQGDIAQLEHLLRTQMQSAGPGPYDVLITRRNRAWVSAIEHELQGSGHTFYAVGAAHLLGDDGVVALLRREGVTVEGPN